MKDISILTGSIFFTLAIASPVTGGGMGNAKPLADIHTFPGSDPPLSERVVEIDEDSLHERCRRLEEDRRRIHYVNARGFRMSMQLRGLYTHGPLLFFRLHVSNHGHLDFEGDSIRFYVVDKQLFYPAAQVVQGLTGKVATSPVTRIKPLYVYGDASKVKGGSEEETIIVLPRFTLPRGRRLVIQLQEPEGGRHLFLHIGNYPLINAKPV